MGKSVGVAGGRKHKEFLVESEQEVLEIPPWETPYNSEDEEYASPVIQLTETRHPRRVQSAAKAAPAQVDPVDIPATCADIDCQPRQGPSRKERKRMTARERAKHVKTLAETVVEEGRVVEECEYIADPAMVFPIAGLPLDIVRDVLLFYIDVPSIVNAMAASRGFRAMMADDLLWRDVFWTQSLEQLDRTLWKRIRNRTKTWSHKAMRMTGILPTSLEEHNVRLLREKHRQEMQRTEESAELRRMLKQRTDDWDEIEEQFYVHSDTGHISMSFQRPMVRMTAGLHWCPYSWYTMDLSYTKQFVRKSAAYRTQYECPHTRVGYNKVRHQAVCLDCNVCAHSAVVPHNVFVF